MIFQIDCEDHIIILNRPSLANTLIWSNDTFKWMVHIIVMKKKASFSIYSNLWSKKPVISSMKSFEDSRAC